MTPEERNLVTELFDRLATLEDAQRDPDAERLIRDGLRQAPNAPYALVQTVLVQDEALKRADARIRQLEAQLGIDRRAAAPGRLPRLHARQPVGPPRRAPRGLGPDGAARASVRRARHAARARRTGGSRPQVRNRRARSRWRARRGQPGSSAADGGGSFLGTAAAAAVGVIGGSLLLDGIRSMMGSGTAAARQLGPQSAAAARKPLGRRRRRQRRHREGRSGGGDLANQAGLDDIGRGAGARRLPAPAAATVCTDGDTARAAGERR